MILLTIIIAVVLVVFIFTTINLLRKNEKQEDILSSYLLYLDRISRVIELSDNRLKEIDAKGTFKSDDEVGFFFEQVTQIQSILNEFQVKETK
tara:strand:+ start:468 stop:746 length:279 start_codon:yes stop_codon:yes gene_type:complete